MMEEKTLDEETLEEGRSMLYKAARAGEYGVYGPLEEWIDRHIGALITEAQHCVELKKTMDEEMIATSWYDAQCQRTQEVKTERDCARRWAFLWKRRLKVAKALECVSIHDAAGRVRRYTEALVDKHRLEAENKKLKAKIAGKEQTKQPREPEAIEPERSE